MVDQLELERIGVDVLRRYAEHTHALELERHAPDGSEVARVDLEGRADIRDGACRVVGGRLDEEGDPMRAVPLIQDLFVVDGVLP